MSTPGGFRALVVDDEPPAVDELRFLLESDDAIAEVHTATRVSDAAAILSQGDIDVVFLDIDMPDVSGLELARMLRSTELMPQCHGRQIAVIFVTAFERLALEAFEVGAVDYLLKPVRQDRLAAALRRIISETPSPPDVARQPDTGARVAVDVAGRTVFIDRSSVMVVEASRDYVRLHTIERSYLVRTPISALEAEWSTAGFVRVHRSFMVAVAFVKELRTEDSGTTLLVGAMEIPVSRTYGRDLKQRLVRNRCAP